MPLPLGVEPAGDRAGWLGAEQNNEHIYTQNFTIATSGRTMDFFEGANVMVHKYPSGKTHYHPHGIIIKCEKFIPNKKLSLLF